METSIYEQYHAHYVAQGVALLDQHMPDWRSRIAGFFNIKSPFSCILGQIYRSQWKPVYDAHQDALADWRHKGQIGERPTTVVSDPYRYGLRLLMDAAGAVDVREVQDVDQWSADHGFLCDEQVDVTRWSPDPVVTRLPLSSLMLSEAWRNAIALTA